MVGQPSTVPYLGRPGQGPGRTQASAIPGGMAGMASPHLSSCHVISHIPVIVPIDGVISDAFAAQTFRHS